MLRHQHVLDAVMWVASHHVRHQHVLDAVMWVASHHLQESQCLGCCHVGRQSPGGVHPLHTTPNEGYSGAHPGYQAAIAFIVCVLDIYVYFLAENRHNLSYFGP